MRAAALALAVLLGVAGNLTVAQQALAAECGPGARIADPSQALAQLRAAQLNRRVTGKGVVVAVVDSGVDVSDPHLPQGSLLVGKSFVPKDATKGLADVYGHGTAIAGVIAARPVKGSSMVGLAPAAKILPVRVFVGDSLTGNDVTVDDADPAAERPTLERIAAGIRWAAENGARIVNVSITSPTSNAALESAVAFATAKGALVVAAAGNRAQISPTELAPSAVQYPAGLKDVLGVAAADATGRAAANSVRGRHVAVAAPGVGIVAPYRRGDCLLAPEAASSSLATGFVSAAAALLAEAYPKATPAELRRRLVGTAALAPNRDDASGFGFVRPLQALALVLDVPKKPVAVPKAAKVSAEQPSGRLPAELVAAAQNPYHDAQRDAGWWTLGGLLGIALLALVGLAAGRRTPSAR